MNIKKFIRIVLLGGFLITILPYTSIKKYCGPKEQILGCFRLGETIEEVKEKLGDIHTVAGSNIYNHDQWTFWIEEDSKTIETISYMELDIQSNYDYPKTSQGITIGSRLEEVEKVYGSPDQIFSIGSWFILRNSELCMEYVYLSRELCIMFINQNPYIGADDWKVVDIVVGNEDVIKGIFSSISLKPITWCKKRYITKAYRKRYGNPKDLEIYDDYILNLQVDCFKHIKSAGEYKVNPFEVIPKESELFYKIFDENAPDIEGLAKEKVVLKYDICLEELEEIIKIVKEFQWDPTYRKIVEIEDNDF